MQLVCKQALPAHAANFMYVTAFPRVCQAPDRPCSTEMMLMRRRMEAKWKSGVHDATSANILEEPACRYLIRASLLYAGQLAAIFSVPS